MADTAKEIAQFTLSKAAHRRRAERSRKMTLLRVGVIVCFFLALLLLLACLQIGRIPIREITFTGNQHYSSEQLQKALEIDVGDSLYGFDTEATAKTLVLACPYLARAEISVSLWGVIEVRVEERIALWALQCQGETKEQMQYLLLDAQMVALEYTTSPCDACVVIYTEIALPDVGQTINAAAKQAQAQYDAWYREQKEKPDEPAPDYVADAQVLTDKLTSLASCFEDMRAASSPSILSLADPYECKLTLRDGTILLMGSAKDIPALLLRARQALSQYLGEQGVGNVNATLTVDLRDPLRVLISEKINQK